MAEKIILRVDRLTKAFGGVIAVNHCSLDFEANRIYGLIGPNGSGKTTLFDLITGVQRPDSGHVYFDGERITRLKPYKIAQRGVSRTFQIIRVFPEMTALENMLVVAPQGTSQTIHAKALELLDFVNLTRLKDEYAGNLSYGQQKLLEFVRALMLDPQLILLDEPAAGVNRTLLNDLLERIHDLRQQGKTIIIVEHDMKVVMNTCEQIYVLDQGEVLAAGLPADIQTDERVMEAYFGH